MWLLHADKCFPYLVYLNQSVITFVIWFGLARLRKCLSVCMAGYLWRYFYALFLTLLRANLKRQASPLNSTPKRFPRFFYISFSSFTSPGAPYRITQLQDDSRLTFSYISFLSFTFPDAPYRIFHQFLPWLPCYFYLVVIEQHYISFSSFTFPGALIISLSKDHFQIKGGHKVIPTPGVESIKNSLVFPRLGCGMRGIG